MFCPFLYSVSLCFFGNSPLYIPRICWIESCLFVGITAVFSPVQGGLFGPLHRNISKVSPFFLTPLKVTCDSCRITAHPVTLLPKSFLDRLSPDTTHDKMLAKSFMCPLSHTHRYLLSLFSQSSAAKSSYLICLPVHFPVFPLCNPPSNISSYSRAWALYPSHPSCHYSFSRPWNPPVREIFILKAKVLTEWDLDGNRTGAN